MRLTSLALALAGALVSTVPVGAAPTRSTDQMDGWACGFRHAAIGTAFSEVVRPSRRIARATVWAIVTTLDLEPGAVSLPPRVMPRRAVIADRTLGC